MVALNAKLNNGSKCQNKYAALNTKLKKMMALNVKQKKDMMDLNAELKTNNSSKCQTKNMALNVKLKNAALNTKLKTQL